MANTPITGARRGPREKSAGAQSWQQRWLDRFYRNKAGWVDGRTQFKNMCRRVIRPGADILDLGAGPANSFTQFLATLGNVTGLDVDDAVLSNEALAEAVVYDGACFPVASESFDAVVSNYAVEHMSRPGLVAAEANRVLRYGGVYVFRTPNRWHPLAAVAAYTPHWFHQLVSTKARNLPAEGTPYPTFYRMNTIRRCQRTLSRAGFTVNEIVMIEKEPSYGMGSRVLFLSFLLYERLANSSDWLRSFRANILCVAQKEQEHSCE